MTPPVHLTSLTDVAQRAGVSVATASRVLSDSDYPVAGRTRRRVLDAAAELDFSPNLIARGLVARRTHLVGLIVPDLVDTRYAAIAGGVEHMATGERLHLAHRQHRTRPGSRDRRRPALAVDARRRGDLLLQLSGKA